MGSERDIGQRTQRANPVLFTVRSPLRSTVARGRYQPKRTPPTQIPCNDAMWSRMRSGPALDIRLEFDIIPRERAHGVIDNFTRECRVEHQ